jgi:folate-binding protein YgfZ
MMAIEVTGALHTVLHGAAFASLNDQAFLRITGADATRWLNGMVTNSIQALHPGEGNYNFLLNAQGRIQGDCIIYREPTADEPAYLLKTDDSQIDNIQELLDRFIIMDDVELHSTARDETSVLLLGYGAPHNLDEYSRQVRGETHGSMPPLRLALDNEIPALITTPLQGKVPRFEVRTADAEPLTRGLVAQGLQPVAFETLEQLRILEARPRYGTDIRDKDLPQETNQPHALHFAKGCYVGQEIVERIRSRGQVHRLFTPFRLKGGLPSSLPAPIEASGKPAGEITSASTIHTSEGPIQVALGYARREFLETNAALTYAEGTVHPRSPGDLE